MKALVIFSHSYQEQSVSNKAILEVLQSAEGVEVRNLEVLYPDGKIDVAAEQAALLAADVVVFQHPTFWFNIPPMLKRWMDDVLTYGFAYGTGGDKLHGKKFIQSLTTGSGDQTYTSALQEVLYAPMRTSAQFCGMEYLEPHPLFGQLALTNPNAAADARAHAERLLKRLQALK